MNKITVSTIPRLDIDEGQKVEFKTSIFYRNGVAGTFQMEVIAKTIAAFMNTEGGDLYIGVRDSTHEVSGLATEFETLAKGGEAIVVRTREYQGDDTLIYSGDADGYERKIRMIVSAYLRPFAETYITYYKEFCEGREYARVEVRPLPANLIAYFPGKKGAEMTEEIWVRRGTHKVCLNGFDRDTFIRQRGEAERVSLQVRLDKLHEMLEGLRANGGGLSKEDILANLKTIISGSKPIVMGGQPITKEGLATFSKPGGLIFDGEHAGDAKTWGDCYQRLLERLNRDCADKFNGLPDDPALGKWFKRQQPKTAGMKRAPKCMGCYQLYLGTAKDVRPVEIVGKTDFYEPDRVVHRLLKYCGIDSEKVQVRPKEM